MRHADYRKHNDGSQNSSTYHKKDGTPTRAILKREMPEEYHEVAAAAAYYEQDGKLELAAYYESVAQMYENKAQRES